MSDDDKPFACSAPACGMRFSTEDHLNVHMRKHEMSLALNLGGGGLIASPSNPFLDQTPTPTKFLRNCEEIGLFQELSKNPFEEAFKKAADLPEGVPLPGPHSNDLNTPVPPDPARLDSVIEVPKLSSSLTAKEDPDKDNSILVIEENEALDLSGRRSETKPQPSSTTTDEDTHVRSTSQAADSSSISPAKLVMSGPGPGKVPAAASNVSNVALIQSAAPLAAAALPTSTAGPSSNQQVYTMQVYLQLPSGQTVPVNIPATIGPVEQAAVSPPQSVPIQQKVPTPPASTTPSTTPTSSMALKQRLKQTLQQNNSPMAVVKTEPTSSSIRSSVLPSQPSTSVLIPDSVSLSASSSDSPVRSPDTNLSEAGFDVKRTKRNSGDDDADERRKKFLERNRAAAARCRQKRKSWIGNLERKADDLQNTNSRLQSEVSLLRGEVAQLKTLLLAHKDCPITLQQKSQGHLALTTINLVESGASASMPTISSSDVSAAQVAGATDSVVMAPGITVIPVTAEHIMASREVGKK